MPIDGMFFRAIFCGQISKGETDALLLQLLLHSANMPLETLATCSWAPANGNLQGTLY